MNYVFIQESFVAYNISNSNEWRLLFYYNHPCILVSTLHNSCCHRSVHYLNKRQTPLKTINFSLFCIEQFNYTQESTTSTKFKSFINHLNFVRIFIYLWLYHRLSILLFIAFGYYCILINLLKEIHYTNDHRGLMCSLHYTT